ncbi:MAG: transposase, partial [Bdellovibrionota bacterium]
MLIKKMTDLDPRLLKRYHTLVQEQMNAHKLSAGLKSLSHKISSFASTQAAWRFYANQEISLSALQEPLTAVAHRGITTDCKQFALCAHDWARLPYKHLNKKDTYATHKADVGYDLQSSLILNDQSGEPIAPVALR